MANKSTVLISHGPSNVERITRVVRDLDFMLLCNGRQYAHCTYDGREIEVSRQRDANGNGTGEWSGISLSSFKSVSRSEQWANDMLNEEYPLD